MENKPTLYIMCGPSGCGKTTWARKYLASNPNMKYVSRDEIRFNLVTENQDYFSKENTVFTNYKNAIKSALIDGFDCVADATHLTSKSREKLVRALGEEYYNIIFVVLLVGRKTAIEQNNLREGRARVPERTLFWQFDHFTMPSKRDFENCKGVWSVDGF